MRLSIFRKLSAKEQKLEVARAKKEIASGYKELCEMGIWNDNATKELKKNGQAVLWERRKIEGEYLKSRNKVL